MKNKSTKHALLASVLSIVMCFAMLIGSTFAWFTDEVKSGMNKIVAGNLDVDLVNADGESLEGQSLKWVAADDRDEILWEPNCTYNLESFKVVNNGNLALKYTVIINGVTGDAPLLEVIDFTVKVGDAEPIPLAEWEGVLIPAGKTPNDVTIEQVGESDLITITGHMDQNAGNEYQGLSLDGLGITVVAGQYTYEKDSTGDQYDENAPKHPRPVVEGGNDEWYKEGETNLEISTAAHLVDFAKRVNEGESFAGKTITLKNDIQLDSSYNWIPIGTMDNKFTGTFDGNGKTVSNLMFDQSMATDAVLAGFFGVVDGATIKNLTVAGNITAYTNTEGASYNCGGICATAYGISTFENCTNNVNIDGTKMGYDADGMLAAGIVGVVPGYVNAKATFTKCINNGNITIGNDDSFGCTAAGITAVNFNGNAVIDEACKNNGTVIAYGEDCAYGDITANEMLGI